MKFAIEMAPRVLRSWSMAFLLIPTIHGQLQPGQNDKPKPGGGVVKPPTPPILKASLGNPPAQLAATCLPGSPVITFHVQVTNVGGSPSAPTAVAAVDSSLMPAWTGETPLPAIAQGQGVTVN